MGVPFLNRKFFGLAFALALMGCSSPHVMLDQAIIRNATTSRITNVKVLHEPTRNIGQVSAILPQRSFILGISGQPMQAKSATVTWKDRNGFQKKVKVALPYDQTAAKEGRAMSLVYTIQPSGNVSVQLLRTDANN